MLKNRFYFWLLSALFFGFLFPIDGVEAHSVLETATPEDGEQLEDAIDNVKLTFSTKVEKGSTLLLEKDDGEEIEPTSVEITDNVLEASFEESLESGLYKVHWNIIGADGHPIENQYSFTISMNEAQDVQQEEDQNSEKKDNNSNVDSETTTQNNKNENPEPQNAREQTSNDRDQINIGATGFIVVLFVAGLLLLVWILFNNRKT
ncbi:copper resistance CopC family protein [Salibacterium qingdaonense]|uniref:CopC domain-containing protein n=1 Tax=Salibacterium qingdaonense TaxID=266892 RepID=A0A1I4IN02_9BACI|nr:copper resistance protein CopC [Salibacterium qingdaonense]SFL55136.1 hypothetical protein SAMN04488054_102111 [Salibacterium qingdaonense]